MGKKIFLYTTATIYLLFFSYIVVISLPNPIQLRYTFFSLNYLHYAVPEGWAFFTKDPKSENLLLYKRKGGGLEKVSLINSQAKYFFGASREARLMNGKISILRSKLKDSDWKRIQFERISPALIDSLKPAVFKVAPPFVYGDFVIRRFVPTPWSWYSISGNMEMLPSFITRIKIIKP